MNGQTGLQELLKRHGARVRRKVAMRLLEVSCEATFYKIVAACPRIKHRLPGETHYKYLVEVICEINAGGASSNVGENVSAVGGGNQQQRRALK